MKNDKVDMGKAKTLQHPILWGCLSTQFAGGPASFKDIVGGAQTSDSASNLLSATHETVTDLSLDLYLSWTRFLHLYMGTSLGPWWVDQHSFQTVLLLLSSKDSTLPLTSLYRDKQEGSVVMFGGLDNWYYKEELNWVPLIQAGD